MTSFVLTNAEYNLLLRIIECHFETGKRREAADLLIRNIKSQGSRLICRNGLIMSNKEDK